MSGKNRRRMETAKLIRAKREKKGMNEREEQKKDGNGKVDQGQKRKERNEQKRTGRDIGLFWTDNMAVGIRKNKTIQKAHFSVMPSA